MKIGIITVSVLVAFFFRCTPKEKYPICFVKGNTPSIDTISFDRLLTSNLSKKFNTNRQELPDVLYFSRDHLRQLSIVSEAEFVQSARNGEFTLNALSPNMIQELSKFENISLDLRNVHTPPKDIKKLKLNTLSLMDSTASVFDLKNLEGCTINRLFISNGRAFSKGKKSAFSIIGKISLINKLEIMGVGDSLIDIQDLENTKLLQFSISGKISENVISKLCNIKGLKQLFIFAYELNSIGCISFLTELEFFLVHGLKSLPQDVKWPKSIEFAVSFYEEEGNREKYREMCKPFSQRTGIKVRGTGFF